MYWLIILTLLEGGLFAKPIKAFPSYADCQYAMHGVEAVIKEEHQNGSLYLHQLSVTLLSN